MLGPAAPPVHLVAISVLKHGNDKLRVAHEKLQDAVAEIVSGDEWKRMLKVASKFHRYSFNNHLMIFLQRPDATVVVGVSPHADPYLWLVLDRRGGLRPNAPTAAARFAWFIYPQAAVTL